jgi:hypothetical protein
MSKKLYIALPPFSLCKIQRIACEEPNLQTMSGCTHIIQDDEALLPVNIGKVNYDAGFRIVPDSRLACRAMCFLKLANAI